MLYKLNLGINLITGPYGVGVIKTTGNIGIYRPRVFYVRYGTNKSYLLGASFIIFDAEVKGIKSR